jgi:hypothetical protein
MLEVGISSSLWSPKLTTVVQWCWNLVMNIHFCCHLCYSSCVIFRSSPSQCATVSFCRCWFSPTVSPRLPTIRVCRHNLRKSRSRYT